MRFCSCLLCFVGNVISRRWASIWISNWTGWPATSGEPARQSELGHRQPHNQTTAQTWQHIDTRAEYNHSASGRYSTHLVWKALGPRSETGAFHPSPIAPGSSAALLAKVLGGCPTSRQSHPPGHQLFDGFECIAAQMQLHLDFVVGACSPLLADPIGRSRASFLAAGKTLVP